MKLRQSRLFLTIGMLLLVVLFGCTQAPSFEVTINFDSNGGTTVESVIYDGEGTIHIPDNPTKEGYIFSGWYRDNGTFEIPFTSISLLNEQILSDFTVYAKWDLIDNILTLQLKHIYDLAIEMSAFTGTYDEWLETVRGPQGIPGEPGKSTLIRINSGFIQWQHQGDTAWHNLIALSELIGPKGEDGLSAFEIYMIYNPSFQGTEEDWINDLIKNIASQFDVTVTFDLIEGNIDSTSNYQVTLEKGTYLSNIPIPEKEGYEFLGWTTGFSVSDVLFTTLTPVLNDLILYAKWQVNQYTITFDSHGGTNVNPIVKDYKLALNQPTDPTLTGHTFIQWHTNPELTNPYVFTTMPAKDLTLYAEWEIADFNLVVVTDGNILEILTFTYEETIVLPADPIKLSQVFLGWYLDEEFTIPFTLLAMPAEDLTIYAKLRAPFNNIITIGIDNDTMGAALVEKWNQDFPDLVGKLVFKNYGSANGPNSGVEGIQIGQGDAPSVALVIDNDILGRQGTLMPLKGKINDIGLNQSHYNAFNSALINDVAYYIPAFYDGMSFSWNETMLTQLGVDLTDANGDGLPDALDTWEKIFAWSNTWATLADRPTFTFTKADNTVVNNKILEVFPISLDEVWSGYSSLTAGGWQLFQEGDLTAHGFDKAEFREGLEFIKAFSETKMSVDDTGAKKNADAMGWRWDQYLDGAYPFGLVGTWMNVDGKEQENNLNFRFSAMPTYNGIQLTSLMKTKGFVINKHTNDYEEALYLLEWLYTKDVLEVMIENSPYTPALQEDAVIYPDINSQNKAEFALGMRFNTLEPLGFLPNAPIVRAMNIYYSIGIGDFYKAVWNETQTPTQAQTAIVTAAQAWIEANNVAP